MDITLQWDANLKPDLAGYKIYYKTGSSGSSYDGTGIDQGNSPITLGIGNPDDPNNPLYTPEDPDNPRFTLTGLGDNEIYFFVVTSYDTENHESSYSNEVDTDEDNDEMADNWETQKGVTDPDADPDDDGLTNREEFENLTEPLDSDTDADGMPDGWEVVYRINALVDDADKDIDLDGLMNLKEYQTGSDPRDRNDPEPQPIKAMPWIPLLLDD
jgi:hypothetical protein